MGSPFLYDMQGGVPSPQDQANSLAQLMQAGQANVYGNQQLQAIHWRSQSQGLMQITAVEGQAIYQLPGPGAVIQVDSLDDFTYHDYCNERRAAHRRFGGGIDIAQRRYALAHIIGALMLHAWKKTWRIAAVGSALEAAHLLHAF